METSQVLVTGVGITIVILIALFFFTSSKGKAMEALQHQGAQHQRIIVKGGYSPNTIRLKQGVPAELIFERHETTGCSDELVFPDFGIRRALPAHTQTKVEFTPDKAGSFQFTCGMNMLRGTIVVEETK